MSIFRSHLPYGMGAAILFSSLFYLFFPQTSFAFSCTSNGVSIGTAGTFNVPIDVTINKTDVNILLTDLSKYTTCEGDVGSGFRDALRTTGATISSDLTSAGFSGYVDLVGREFSVPPGTQCIWPDGSCSISSGVRTIPLQVKIGIKKTGSSTKSLTLPAGTELATLSVEQRSVSTWGWAKTWRFTLKNALVIPNYTCQVTNPIQTVTMPSVSNVNLVNHGAGIYPGSRKFNINLDCEPDTAVSIQFDGTSMTGTTDVLENTSTGSKSVGIQITQNGTPVKLGTSLKMIANAAASESLEFEGNYYYNGGPVSAGPVTSVATFTMEYN